MSSYKNIIISRTDGIGDVVLALPMAGVLKELYPDCNLIFLGWDYTKVVIDSCKYIDRFVGWDDIIKLGDKAAVDYFRSLQADVIIHVYPRKSIAELARKANIPLRIGTSHRHYHWHTCNRLIGLSRRRSVHHEAQLNLKLLVSLGAKKNFDLAEIPKYYGFSKIGNPDARFKSLLSAEKFNLIIHPSSKGSAREWGMRNYQGLLNILPKDKFKVFISGTEEEGLTAKPFLMDNFPDIVDLTGKMSLPELISFISLADGLLATSTGPLHIAAALGKYALGLYAPMRPIHPGRWAPLGEKATYIVKEKYCSKCRHSMRCECIESITSVEVMEKLLQFKKTNG
jgi:ADP-heptose:LPS heptosyltransferase